MARVSEEARGRDGENGGFDNDSLKSIEFAAVEAGDGNDTVIIDSNSDFDRIKYIDLGDQQPDDFDVIDFRDFSEDVSVDFAKSLLAFAGEEIPTPPSTFNPDPEPIRTAVTVDIRRAEKVLAGDGNDVLFAGVSAQNIRGRLGSFEEAVIENITIGIDGVRRSLSNVTVELSENASRTQS